MLEIVRHHGLGRLAESGEEDLIRGRHCRQVRSLVERAVTVGPADAGPWPDRLREEHRNVREAVAWLRPRDPEAAARLVTDVGWFWGGVEQVGETRDCPPWILQSGGHVVAPTDERPLTRRERQVARLVADGLTNRLIAAELGVAERTVDAHVDHIRNKLSVRSRAQIARWVTERMAAPGPPSAGERPSR
jgi:DNA-binding CsgD family transcriptional regulator